MSVKNEVDITASNNSQVQQALIFLDNLMNIKNLLLNWIIWVKKFSR